MFLRTKYRSCLLYKVRETIKQHRNTTLPVVAVVAGVGNRLFAIMVVEYLSVLRAEYIIYCPPDTSTHCSSFTPIIYLVFYKQMDPKQA